MTKDSILLSLPEEIIENTLKFIPDDDSALLDISLVCKKLYRLSNSPLEWRARCRRFRYWEPRHEYQKKVKHPLPAEVDWRSLFVERIYSYKRTTMLLNEIISSPVDRIKKFNKIADLGYDAKDCLAEHANASDDVEDVLARRWYASAAIRYIHRRQAIIGWKKLASGEDISLEYALGCFELFILKTPEGDIDDISGILDELAARFKSETTNFADMSTKAKALALCTYMNREGFRGASYESYRALKNAFIGVSLRTDRTNLPLTATAIYCSLATRVGLAAYPCGFPYHVLAIVRNEDGNYIYLDPFRGEGNELPVQGLEHQLSELGVGATMDEFLRPSPTTDIVLRTSRNILESLRRAPGPSDIQQEAVEIDRHSALYAALTASALLGPRITLNVVQHMARRIQDEYSMDVQFFEEDIVPKLEDRNARELLLEMCGELRAEDSAQRPVSRRENLDGNDVRYRVGTVFVHKRYPFQGVVFGWSRTCAPREGEEWMQTMGVDTLSRGRHQPFYLALVMDGSVRYVAEENIVVSQTDPVESLRKLAGKYFKRYSRAERMFISNIRDEYPDD